MKKPRSFTEEEIKSICQRYLDEGSRALAKEFHVRKATIITIVKAHEIDMKKAGRPKS